MSATHARTVTLHELIQSMVDGGGRGLGVALPGNVISYDSSTRTCSVQPGVSRLIVSEDDPDLDEPEDLPPIQNVPVCWPVGRGFALGEVSLSAGDPVLLICCDLDISVWRRTGDLSEPDDARYHHWGSAVALPGLVPTTNPIPVPSDAAALASLVFAELDALRTTLNALITKYNAHGHAGNGATAPAAPATAHGEIGDVASDVLKVSS